MLDLFQPPKPPAATRARVVQLLTDDDPRGKPGRKFYGPPKPPKPCKRTPEQHQVKYQRYLERHGREYVLALARKRYAENKHDSLAQKREKYATDPAYRERQKAAAAAQRARKKAAREAAGGADA